MTPAQLIPYARALYGPAWQTPLATLLNVTPRQIQYWLNGERLTPSGHIPAKHLPTLKAAMSLHAAKLRKLARTIPNPERTDHA